jgi:arylsulfatase A-like enzyme
VDDALKGHAAMITRLDADVGRIQQHLKVMGLERKTLIIFTSDNGPHKEGAADSTFFEPSGPLNGFKRDLTDGGIRVPFIATWPGKIQSAVSSHIGYFGDLMATFAELADASAPEKIDSISIVPTFLSRSMVPVGRAPSVKNPPQPTHQHLYWEFHESGFSQAVLLGNRLERHSAQTPRRTHPALRSLYRSGGKKGCRGGLSSDR